MTTPRQHLCTLGGHLPLALAEQLVGLIGTAAEQAGYTDVGLGSDGRITATPPPRSRPHPEHPPTTPPAATP